MLAPPRRDLRHALKTTDSSRAGARNAAGARLTARVTVLLALLATPAAAQVAPDAVWRTLDTPHFRVNYSAGLDSLAYRTASRAEWAYEVLTSELSDPPGGRIDIVLADNVDFANGSATPWPTNRIILYAHPPVDVAELSFTTDWLELLVLHELVHIFHLDDAGGVWAALRSLLGRNALLFPNVFLPSWVHEGLATYYESRLTPAGRVRGSLFEMALRTAMLDGDFFSIDRVTGEPRSWPGGSTRYVYGALFLDFLSRRYGEGRVPEFVRRYGGQTIPYRLDAAARRAFGASLTGAWAEWTDSLRVRYEADAAAVAAAGATQPEILTSAGRDAYHPRYAPDGELIAYAAATGRDQPGLRLLLPDGEEREIAPLAQLGPSSWTRDGEALIYGELDYRGPYRLYSDLRRAELDGSVRRLTRAARVAQPDLHPDGRTLVAVLGSGGTNVLVAGDPEAGELRPLGEPTLDVHWGHPRWSPDGQRIAAMRWSPGGLHDIVLLDPQGRVTQEITHDRAIDSSPAWSPDGQYLLFWSDRTGIPNLFAFDLQANRLLQVTNVVTGAIDPDVSPDGRWIAFSYYRADGYHIARIPMRPEDWRPAAPPRDVARPLVAPRRHPPVAGEPRPYSSWPSVAPAAWTPVVSAPGLALGPGLGAVLYGADVVRRHVWAAEGLLYADGWRLDGGGVYRYQGWGNPAVEAGVSQDWTALCEAEDADCSPVPAIPLRRHREAEVSLLWVRQRIRSTAWLRPGISLEKRDFEWDDPGRAEGATFAPTAPDAGVRLELGRSSVRGFSLSVGPQAGYSLVSTVEGHRYTRMLENTDAREYLRLTERGRGYRSVSWGRARHVLAVRADLGVDLGARSPGFDVGGATGGALPIALEVDVFGRGVSFPIRGYPEGVQYGNRAVTASAEYRFPLARVERGVGLLPVYLDRLTGDLFADAGTAWCAGVCPRFAEAPSEPRLLPSVGAEVLAELRFGYHTTVPLRLGAALPLRDDGGPRVYVRVGRGF